MIFTDFGLKYINTYCVYCKNCSGYTDI